MVAAQDMKLPPAMKGALDRIGNGDSDLSRLQTHQLLGTAAALRELQSPSAAPKTCSVPLLEMPVDHPERFTMLKITPKQKTASMPHAVVPAPPCDQHKP